MTDASPSNTPRVFTRAAVRELDLAATRDYAIPSLVLMENASRAVADAALAILADARAPAGPAFILCGPGNNGGDGLAAARHLHNAGVAVVLVLAAPDDHHSKDARAHLDIARRMALPILEAHADPGRALDLATDRHGAPRLVVDALLGTGADRPLRPPIDALVRWTAAARSPTCLVLAVDIPTGMHCDTGAPLTPGAQPPIVPADVTITLAGWKQGFLAPAAREWLGRVVVGSIGAPRELVERLSRPLHPAP